MSPKQEDKTLVSVTPVEAQTIADNPCWGSPSICSLRDLLRHYQKHQFIVYDSKDYVGVHKPPDLRMDGPHAATFLKLLSYLFPTRTLREGIPNETERLEWIEKHVHNYGDCRRKLLARTEGDETKNTEAGQEDDDGPLRPCHQLDYATSGVLWVARSAAAANVARKAFEERRVSKTYLALVHGHIRLEDLPIFKRVDDWLAATEKAYRKQRQKKGRKVLGCMPPHSMFSKWQSYHRKKNGTTPKKAKRPKPQPPVFSEDEWKEIWAPFEEHVASLQPEIVEALLTMDWKIFRGEHNAAKHYFTTASDKYNERFLAQQDEANKAKSDDLNIPTVFQEEPGNVFFVSAPIAQVKDDFAMRIPSSYQNMLSATTSLKASDDEAIDFKPSLTRCTILAHSTSDNDGQSLVTKVSLEPRTGRQHQLRVHMALLGHPIVRDMTYCATSDDTKRGGRMCLHSHRLQVSSPALSMEAPDPFPQQ